MITSAQIIHLSKKSEEDKCFLPDCDTLSHYLLSSDVVTLRVYCCHMHQREAGALLHNAELSDIGVLRQALAELAQRTGRLEEQLKQVKWVAECALSSGNGY